MPTRKRNTTTVCEYVDDCSIDFPEEKILLSTLLSRLKPEDREAMIRLGDGEAPSFLFKDLSHQGSLNKVKRIYRFLRGESKCY